MMAKIRYATFVVACTVLVSSSAQGQEPYRAGTTAASFLEIGFGSAGNAMGDAHVSTVRDLSAAYWNPAGLGYMQRNEFQVMYQPWLADVSTSFVAVGYVNDLLGTFALSYYQIGFGEEDVTTLDSQSGTGEKFSGSDYAASLSYGKLLAEWFSFGTSVKLVGSNIWHSNAMAVAFDLGAVVNTAFLSPTGDKANGVNIGMSISNYGTRLKYDGIDLKRPVDILPEEQGNFRDVPARFELESWELPLIFRIGISATPIVSSRNKLTLAVNALHPNNNSESLNVGGEYQVMIPSFGTLSLRGGYKGIYMNESEYGPSFGGGVFIRQMNNRGLKIDYAYRDIGLFGATHSYTLALLF